MATMAPGRIIVPSCACTQVELVMCVPYQGVGEFSGLQVAIECDCYLRSAAAEIGRSAAASRSQTSAGVPGGLRQAAAVALIA